MNLVFIPHSGVAKLPPPGSLAVRLRTFQRPSVALVQAIVADSFGIPREAMKSPARHKTWAKPRQIAMYICRRELKLSYPLIGREFGGRDHTTVMHAVRCVAGRISYSPDFADDVLALRQAVREAEAA